MTCSRLAHPTCPPPFRLRYRKRSNTLLLLTRMEGGSPAFACGVATFPGFDTAVGFGSEPLVVAHGTMGCNLPEECSSAQASFLRTGSPSNLFSTSTPVPRDGECGKQSR